MKRTREDTQLSLFVHEIDEFPSLNLTVRRPVEDSASAETAVFPVTLPSEPPANHDRDDLSHSGEIPECEWSEFMRVHGRTPRLGDQKQPWQYRGWLLYYRMLCEKHPEIAPRWDYWIRTRFAGQLLAEPIPMLQFETCGSRDCYKLLEEWLHLIDRLHSHWSPMDILLDWLSWGFALSHEPPKISERLNEELYRAVNIGPLLLKPYDYLGEWIANQKGKWNPHAFFPTPHSVVELMVRINFDCDPPEDMRSQTVLDPALGSGRMLLHASNFSLRLFGVDIDPLMVKTALVNGALYAPWMLRPFPDRYFDEPTKHASTNVVQGESLAVS